MHGIEEEFEEDSLGELTLPSTIHDQISAIDPQDLQEWEQTPSKYEDNPSISTLCESPYSNHSDDSRYLFEKSYANWAAQADERVLPASSSREIQFLTPAGAIRRQNASPETISIHERLYNQASILENRRKAQQNKLWDQSQTKLSVNKSTRSRSSSTGAQSMRKGPIHSRLFEWKAKRDARVDRMREHVFKARDDIELAETTFKPRLTRTFSSSALDREPSKVFDKLYNDRIVYSRRRKERM